MARRAMSIRHPRDLQNEPLACSGSTPWPPSRSRHRAQPPSSLGRKKLRLGAGTFVKIKASMRRACKQHAPRQHCQSAFPFQDAPCRKWCHSAISPDPGPGAGVLVAQLCYDTRQLRQSAGHRQRQRAAGHPDRMRPNGRGHHGQGPEPGWPSQSQSQDHAAAPALPATRTSSVGRPVARCERRSGPRRFDERADDAMG